MRTKNQPSGKDFFMIIPLVLISIVFAVSFQSCQKEEPIVLQAENNLKSATLENPTLYWGHEIFTRNTGKPVVVTKNIGSSDLSNFKPDFVLNVKNGDVKNRVSSAVIKIDGKQIFGTSDFSQKVVSLSKGITGLTATSVLEVELRSSPGSYIDVWIDGDLYKTVIIGTKTWMAENLRATIYNDGTPIPCVTDVTAWANLTIPAYCWYNNDESTNKNTYGALYNWYAVNTGKLCPAGWHVPSDAEWTSLSNYLGGYIVAGGEMKETGTSHWLSPNTDATNESGFTALPGGSCFSGRFDYIGLYGYWWSSTAYFYNSYSAWNRTVEYDNSSVGRYPTSKSIGFSVRCLQN